MFELTIRAEFCAAHALTLGSTVEPLHGHNWRVKAVVEGRRLDASGLLCDFHVVEKALAGVIKPWNNANLNETPPFTTRARAVHNPSAENVAAHIADELSRALSHTLPAGVRVASVTVTEAPGCAATYRLPAPPE
ncbi:MAG: 6-carboxytetrahydropterin synthase [Phycisphaerales bacterium]|nr:6-carboxytetrahydropterin synthase [Phycisphaerales bacterium]